MVRRLATPDLDRYKFPDDPASLLMSLGVQKVRLRGKRVTGVCPFHPNADQEDGFYGILATGTYGCGTVQCIKPTDLIGVVQKLTGTDFKGAMAIIGQHAGYGDSAPDFRPVLRRHMHVAPAAPKPSPRITQGLIDEAVTRYWQRAGAGYWAGRSRAFADDTLRLFHAGLLVNREGSRETGFAEVERAIFPVHGFDGALVGWTGRAIRDSQVNHKAAPGAPVVPKWRHWPAQRTDRETGEVLDPGFEARQHLFGWRVNRWTVDGSDRVILVEGPGDVLSGTELALSLGEDWCPLGVFGTTLKGEQARQLRRAGVGEVWAVIDSDELDSQGRRAGENMIESVRREMPFADRWLIRMPPGVKDLGEVKDPALYRALIESRQAF
jgi:hypothetical protein